MRLLRGVSTGTITAVIGVVSRTAADLRRVNSDKTMKTKRVGVAIRAAKSTASIAGLGSSAIACDEPEGLGRSEKKTDNPTIEIINPHARRIVFGDSGPHKLYQQTTLGASHRPHVKSKLYCR